MAALTDLLGRHANTGVPIFGEHRLTECLRAVGVGSLTDDQERVVLGEGNGRIQRGHARLAGGFALQWCNAAHSFHHLTKVFRGGATAAADDRNSQVGDVMTVILGELFGRQVVVGLAVNNAGKTGIGQHRDGNGAVFAQVAQVFLHLGRTRRTVDADDVGLHRFQRGESSTDFCSDKHATGCLHRDLHLNRHGASDDLHRPTTCLHRGFDLQQVHAGLDEEQVGPSIEESARLLNVCLAQFNKTYVAKTRKFGARSDASGDVARSAVRFVFVGDTACNGCSRHVELVGLFRNFVFSEHSRERAE